MVDIGERIIVSIPRSIRDTRYSNVQYTSTVSAVIMEIVDKTHLIVFNESDRHAMVIKRNWICDRQQSETTRKRCVHYKDNYEYIPTLTCTGDIFHDCHPCEKRGICISCCTDCKEHTYLRREFLIDNREYLRFRYDEI